MDHDGVPEQWAASLEGEVTSRNWEKLQAFVSRERFVYEVYPAQEDVFAAFKLTGFDDVRLVILGQDPYFNPGQANGLCFSVPPGVAMPPSLRNIFEAMRAEGIAPPPDGDLRGWARQGVLLLNTTLTVRRGVPNSHRGQGWEAFTDAVIRALSDHHERLVFMLWGRAAQRKQRHVDAERHAVLLSAHPAARRNALNPLRDAQLFSRANAVLEEAGGSPIDWARAGADAEGGPPF
jgi:uracil-DNA glycosylase